MFDVDDLKAVLSVGMKTAVRVWFPAASELAELDAVPAVALTPGPRFVVPSMNCTLPTALEGDTAAVRSTVVPAGCGLAGAAVSVVVVFVGPPDTGGQYTCVQVVPLIWTSARKYWASAPVGEEVTSRIW